MAEHVCATSPGHSVLLHSNSETFSNITNNADYLLLCTVHITMKLVKEQHSSHVISLKNTGSLFHLHQACVAFSVTTLHAHIKNFNIVLTTLKSKKSLFILCCN